MVKIRILPENNYAAVFDGFTTTRFYIDDDKPITKLHWFESYDVALNDKCYGNCPYCYTNAKHTGRNFPNVVERIKAYFGAMTPNQRPFQVAIGGAGEPTLHPDFVEVLKTFRELGIVPNYTTNGMHLTPAILEGTRKYAGGVAVSTHPHLNWRGAVHQLRGYTDSLHLHIIVGDNESVDEFFRIREEMNDVVDAFVLLPLKPTGRSKDGYSDEAINYCLDRLEAEGHAKVAYGAYFYEALKERPALEPSLYEPHDFSAYLIADEDLVCYDNSFDLVEIRRGLPNVPTQV